MTYVSPHPTLFMLDYGTNDDGSAGVWNFHSDFTIASGRGIEGSWRWNPRLEQVEWNLYRALGPVKIDEDNDMWFVAIATVTRKYKAWVKLEADL